MKLLDHSHSGHMHSEGTSFSSVVEHSFIDTIPMIPILLITFIFIEYIEHKFSKGLQTKIRSAGGLGPLIGALIGIIPQCGFSVVAVALYSRNIVSLGTLISIFVATSDEAIPVLLSMPESYDMVIPFIIIKVIIAVIAGYIIDIILLYRNKKLEIATTKEVELVSSPCIEENTINIKNVIIHSLERTFKVYAYIILVTISISLMIEYIGIQTLSNTLFKGGVLQVFLSSVIGLVPNCAVSVALVQLYTSNVLSFASVMAGLSSNAGLGLIFLFKESKNKKNALMITIILLLMSFSAGVIIQFVSSIK
ncbi:MAG: putative manganese transporter [Clostridium sp.]